MSADTSTRASVSSNMKPHNFSTALLLNETAIDSPCLLYVHVTKPSRVLGVTTMVVTASSLLPSSSMIGNLTLSNDLPTPSIPVNVSSNGASSVAASSPTTLAKFLYKSRIIASVKSTKCFSASFRALPFSDGSVVDGINRRSAFAVLSALDLVLNRSMVVLLASPATAPVELRC